MQHPVITLFCAFTRAWAVDQWLDNLIKLDHNPGLTNLVFIIDIDDPTIANRLRNFAAVHNYRSFHLTMNDDHEPNEVRIARRRERIAFVKNQSKDLIAATDGEFVVCFEDDTIATHKDTILRLLEPLKDPEVGFVQGVQAGRWGVKMLGVWDVYHGGDGQDQGVAGVPIRAETLLPGKGLEMISAGGFYGYATPRKLYLNHDYFQSSSQVWGPDVNYGLWVTDQGYKCLVDWDLKFGHRDFNKVIWPDDNITKIVYNRDIETGRWTRNDYEEASQI